MQNDGGILSKADNVGSGDLTSRNVNCRHAVSSN